MKITKLVHSCLLVEKDSKKILVDPGVYSWQDQKVKNSDFSGISDVVVTHDHPDHFNEEFAKAIISASPEANWYGTQEIVTRLSELGIEGFKASDDQDIQFIDSSHDDLSPWNDIQPEHTSYVLFDELLVSGDCHSLYSSHGARIFAGAINGGPWGGVVGFLKMIEKMSDRPQVILPLHDWHWNEVARNSIYEKLPEVLSKFEVKFLSLENCIEQEV